IQFAQKAEQICRGFPQVLAGTKLANFRKMFYALRRAPGEESTSFVRRHGEGKRIIPENQRSTRCVVRGKLAGYFRAVNRFRRNDFTKCRKLFGRDRSAAKQFHSSVSHGDDGRFDSVKGCSPINNERNSSVEFVENMPRGGRADTAK